MKRSRHSGWRPLVKQLRTAALMALAGVVVGEIFQAMMRGEDLEMATWRLRVEWWLERLLALYGRLGERQEAAQVRESVRTIARAKQ